MNEQKTGKSKLDKGIFRAIKKMEPCITAPL